MDSSTEFQESSRIKHKHKKKKTNKDLQIDNELFTPPENVNELSSNPNKKHKLNRHLADSVSSTEDGSPKKISSSKKRKEADNFEGVFSTDVTPVKKKKKKSDKVDSIPALQQEASLEVMGQKHKKHKNIDHAIDETLSTVPPVNFTEQSEVSPKKKKKKKNKEQADDDSTTVNVETMELETTFSKKIKKNPIGPDVGEEQNKSPNKTLKSPKKKTNVPSTNLVTGGLGYLDSQQPSLDNSVNRNDKSIHERGVSHVSKADFPVLPKEMQFKARLGKNVSKSLLKSFEHIDVSSKKRHKNRIHGTQTPMSDSSTGSWVIFPENTSTPLEGLPKKSKKSRPDKVHLPSEKSAETAINYNILDESNKKKRVSAKSSVKRSSKVSKAKNNDKSEKGNNKNQDIQAPDEVTLIKPINNKANSKEHVKKDHVVLDKNMERSSIKDIENLIDVSYKPALLKKKSTKRSVEPLEKLDVSEWPIDFDIPLLHRDENLKPLPKEIKEDFIKQGVLNQKKWSPEEKLILCQNYLHFMKHLNITDCSFIVGIKSGKTRMYLKNKHFYVRLAKGLDNRSLFDVFKHLRLLLNQCSISGDEIIMLKKLHSVLNDNWEVISRAMNKPAFDCLLGLTLCEAKNKVCANEDKNKLSQTVDNTNDTNLKTKSVKKSHKKKVDHKKNVDHVKKKQKWNNKAQACLIYYLYKNEVADTKSIDWTSIHSKLKKYASSGGSLKKKWRKMTKKFAPSVKGSQKEVVAYIVENSLPKILEKCHMDFDDLQKWYELKSYKRVKF